MQSPCQDRQLSRGPYRGVFWGGVVAAGLVLPFVLLMAADVAGLSPLRVLAAVFALAGLWLWEDLWVKAGQSIPLS